MTLRPPRGGFRKSSMTTATDFPAELGRDWIEALSGLRLLPNRDWMPVALAAAFRFGASERLVSVLKKLEGLAWIMQLGRRTILERLNRYADILRTLRIGR